MFEELLQTPDNVRHIMQMMTGSDVRYGGMGEEEGTVPSLVGGWMPDRKLHTDNGEIRFAELMRAGKPILLNLTNNSDLIRAATPWSDRVTVVNAMADTAGSSVLVRPDGYVAWASDVRTELKAALEKWFGAPCRPS